MAVFCLSQKIVTHKEILDLKIVAGAIAYLFSATEKNL